MDRADERVVRQHSRSDFVDRRQLKAPTQIRIDPLTQSWTDFESRRRADQLFSWFVQDDVSVVPDRLNLTGGIKLEHNDYTGFEYQPRASAHLQIHEHHSLWTSVSRAVRTPSRAEKLSPWAWPGPW